MSPHFLLCGKIEDISPLLFADNSFDACFCDPPYLLEFMNKSFDRQHKKEEGANDGQRMQRWHERWAREVYRVLKPGGHVLAFGGTRTIHRLASALEDVGFEINTQLAWMFGSGFPKSHDISKAVDKAKGAEPVDCGPDLYRQAKANRGTTSDKMPSYDKPRAAQSEARILKPSSEDAKNWYGYGTQIKPAMEPLILAMKPLDGTFARNALKWGVGGLNIDECRIPSNGEKLGGGAVSTRSDGWDRPWKHNDEAIRAAKERSEESVKHAEALGRWPSGVLLSHHLDCVETDRTVSPPPNGSIRTGTAAASSSRTGQNTYSPDDRPRGEWQAYRDEVKVWECHPDCPVRMLDEQSGERRSSGLYSTKGTGKRSGRGIDFGGMDKPGTMYEDQGGASRFFYQAKVSTSERDLGLPKGTNLHSTLKPISLCRYLSSLLLPPPRDPSSPLGPRRLLVPFSGTGSEIAGALLAGWEEVWGVEMDVEWVAIAEKRIPAALEKFGNKQQENTPLAY